MNLPICLHLPADLVNRLDAVAVAAGRSRSNTARMILKTALANDEALSRADAPSSPTENKSP